MPENSKNNTRPLSDSATQNSKSFPFLTVLLSMTLFLFFSSQGIAHFETIDEHFWKEDRIGDYKEGWKRIFLGDVVNGMEKTRINDKPGVTIAILSGIGSLFGPSLETHKIKKEDNPAFNDYNTKYTTSINASLRWPLVLLTVLLLPILYWLLYSISNNVLFSSTSVLGVSLSPLLIGMTRIVNPDALLWIFSTLALLSFICLQKKEKYVPFALLAGLFLGLSILSKYTATILIPLFFLTLILYPTIFNSTLPLRSRVNALLLAVLTSLFMFALLMPAVLLNLDHFLYGTFFSPALSPFALPLYIALALFLIDVYLWKEKVTTLLLRVLKKYIHPILSVLALLSLLLIVYSLTNAWLGTPFFPLENIKETSRVSGELLFPQFSEQPFLVKWWNALGVQTQNLIFSLHPLILLGFVFVLIDLIYYTWKKKQTTLESYYPPYTLLFITLTLLMIFLFLLGGLLSDVFAIPRYMIILYPMITIVSITGLMAAATFIVKRIPVPNAQCSMIILPFVLISLISLSMIPSLVTSSPHFFLYQSSLLPMKYSINDAWGIGAYEGAKYLNTLPNSDELIVWTDQQPICQFIDGHCLRSRKIDHENLPPDYLVLTRRGSIRHRFAFKQDAPFDRNPFYEALKEGKIPHHKIILLQRSHNHVIVVPYKEALTSMEDIEMFN